jgi:hypothetical protein
MEFKFMSAIMLMMVENLAISLINVLFYLFDSIIFQWLKIIKTMESIPLKDGSQQKY